MKRTPLSPEDFLEHMRKIMPLKYSAKNNIKIPRFNKDKLKLILFNTPAEDYSNDPKRGTAKQNRRGAIGLCCLASLVEREFGEGTVMIIDMDLQRLTPKDASFLVKKITKFIKYPVVVGVNLFDPNYFLSFCTSSELLSLNKNMINMLLVGGRGFTLTNDTYLKLLPKSEIPVYGIKGEAEECLIEILNGIVDFSKIATRTNQNVVPFVLPMSKLKNFPFPKTPPHQATDGGGHLYYAIESSRSCTYHRCGFCASSFNYPYREYPISLIEEQLNSLPQDIDKKIYFAFNDDNAFGTEKRAIEVVSMIEKLNSQGKKFVWRFLGRGDTLLKLDQIGLIKKAKKLGLEEIAIGVESANDCVLKMMNKGETHKTINQAVEILIKRKIRVKAFTMIGYLNESRPQIEQTINWLYQKSKTHPFMFRHSLFSVAPYEGTPLHEHLIKNGYSWGDLRLYTQAVALGNNLLIKLVDKEKIRISALKLRELIDLVNVHNERLELIQKK